MSGMFVNLGVSKRMICGGPYRQKPDHWFGVKMAREIDAACDVSVPVEDFHVPDNSELVRSAIRAILQKLSRDEPVYVGCMGGVGRTGLMLSLVAKSVGVKDPVSYVRQNYNPKAVETEEQQAYVRDFDVRPLWLDVAVASTFAGGYDLLRLFGAR